MVQPAGPVDGDLGLVVGQFSGRVERGAGVEGGVGVEAVEDGAVFADVEGVRFGFGAGDEVLRRGSVKRLVSGTGDLDIGEDGNEAEGICGRIQTE